MHSPHSLRQKTTAVNKLRSLSLDQSLSGHALWRALRGVGWLIMIIIHYCWCTVSQLIEWRVVYTAEWTIGNQTVSGFQISEPITVYQPYFEIPVIILTPSCHRYSPFAALHAFSQHLSKCLLAMFIHRPLSASVFETTGPFRSARKQRSTSG